MRWAFASPPFRQPRRACARASPSAAGAAPRRGAITYDLGTPMNERSTEHTRVDHGPENIDSTMSLTAGRTVLPSAPTSGTAADKVLCEACPVLCHISVGRTGACDRYGNVDGVLTRIDPIV